MSQTIIIKINLPFLHLPFLLRLFQTGIFQMNTEQRFEENKGANIDSPRCSKPVHNQFSRERKGDRERKRGKANVETFAFRNSEIRLISSPHIRDQFSKKKEKEKSKFESINLIHKSIIFVPQRFLFSLSRSIRGGTETRDRKESDGGSRDNRD